MEEPTLSSSHFSPFFERLQSLYRTLFPDRPLHAAAQAVILSAFFFVSHRACSALSSAIYDRCTVTIHLDSRDESYRWFIEWLSRLPYTASASNIAVTSNSLLCFGFRPNPAQEDGEDLPYTRLQFSDHQSAASPLLSSFASKDSSPFDPTPTPSSSPFPVSSSSTVLQQAQLSARNRISFTPGPGHHWLRYRGKLMRFERDRAALDSSSASSGSIRESLTITLFFASRRFAEQMLYEAVSDSVRRDANRTLVYVPDAYGGWRRAGSKPPRALASVVLRAGQAEELLGDILRFGQSEEWYALRGIPWRRAYLLHGPPGNGKTSFIAAIAGELGVNIYVLNLSSRHITDENLSDLISQTPRRCVLLLEDIDAAFAEKTDGNLTHSGLLNAIDGVGSVEGRLFFMTTNHRDALSEAMLRPGRTDVQYYFGNATRSQVMRMFVNFFPSASTADALQFADHFIPVDANTDSNISMATVQNFLMTHRGTAQEALEAIQKKIHS